MTDEKGETFFVGKDVAQALGYKNTLDAIRKHVDAEDKGIAKCDTLGGGQNFVIINESGLYALVLSSKLEPRYVFLTWWAMDCVLMLHRLPQAQFLRRRSMVVFA